MHVSLFVPAALPSNSGALAYDRRMAEGLRALGHGVDVVELAGRFPDPDQAAFDAAHAAWGRLAADSLPLIDGLALPAFAGLAAALGPRRAVALIHYPASLEPFAPQETRRRLHAIEAPLFQASPRLVVTSEQAVDQLATGFGLDRDRIAVIAPGVGEPPRSRSGSSGSACAILAVGPLIPRKGHDVLLRGLSRLLDLDWRLTIAGAPDLDAAHARHLHELAEDLHVAQRVRFAGVLEAEAMETLWQGADLFALASWLEGYGMALAEALRRGLPVAVTATGAAPALVEPGAGVVCMPGDVEQLSKAVRRLIFDRTLRRDMADVAWQSARALPAWHDQAVRLAGVLAE